MSVNVGVAYTFAYLSLGVGALSMRNHYGSYGHIFDLGIRGKWCSKYLKSLGLRSRLWTGHDIYGIIYI